MQTIQLPLSGYVAGDTFPSFSILIDDATGPGVISARIHFRPTIDAYPALQFDSADGSIQVTPQLAGKQSLVMASVIRPRLFAGTYTGDLEVTYADDAVRTMFRIQFQVLADFTR